MMATLGCTGIHPATLYQFDLALKPVRCIAAQPPRTSGPATLDLVLSSGSPVSGRAGVEGPSDAEDSANAEPHTDDAAVGDGAVESITPPSTTLVEVVPGVAVVFGDVPDGLDLVDFGLIPSLDRTRLSTALASIGNSAAVAGNVANAAASAEGLYRVNEATLALLKSGGQLAAKDGANLGAIFVDGKVVAQARFIPYGVTAAQAAAALGPAVAMIALQMQLSEISGLVRTNIALTTQTLKAIRHEQWSELTGLADTIDGTIEQASEIGAVTESLWEHVAGRGDPLRKQLDLYRRNVNGHIVQLGRVRGNARREYLETNAEAILFDANALLLSLKAHTGYEALRAARARTNGVDDEHELHLVEVITRDARIEFDSALEKASDLVEALTRELRIIAELPGGGTIPLTKKRRDSKASRGTCAQILAAIGPLAEALHPAVEELDVPGVVCAPEGLDMDPFLHVLRWFMEDGETLRGLAFPYLSGSRDPVGTMLGKRVDASWAGLVPGKWATVVDRAASSTFVALTDRRVMTASPRNLLQHGEIGTGFTLGEVRYVRMTTSTDDIARTSIDVTTRANDARWIFPSVADDGEIGKLATMLKEAMSLPDDERAVTEGLRVPAVDDSNRIEPGEP